MARSTGALRHTHQYYQHKVNGRITWACMKDGCTHFIPGNMPAPIGKMTICHTCEKEMQFLPTNLSQEFPRCERCQAMYEVAQEMAQRTEEPRFEMPTYPRKHPMVPEQPKPRPVHKPEPDVIEVYEPVIPNITSMKPRTNYQNPTPVKLVRKEPELNDEMDVIDPKEITDDYPWLQGEDDE